MSVSETIGESFSGEQADLLAQKAVPILWLGILFFLFFSLLDYFVHRPFFPLFLSYRLTLAIFVLVLLSLLHFRSLQRHALLLMGTALVAASFTISMMVIHIGGFSSPYYIGIVLTASFAFSVLPMTVSQVTGIGIAMYAVYIGTQIHSGYPLTRQEFVHAVTNTVFYFSILLVITIKVHDDIKIRRSIWQGRRKMHQLRNELTIYTGDLEYLVEQRLQQLEELKFRFSELYENIMDMVAVVGEQGEVLLCNKHFAKEFGVSDQTVPAPCLFDFFVGKRRNKMVAQMLPRFTGRAPIYGVETAMVTAAGKEIVVEISGSWVDIDNSGPGCQLVLRNITKRKKMEQQMLESTRLIDHSRRTAILGLAKLAEYRDQDTGAHLERIREYTRILTRALSGQSGLQHLITPSFLEDITLSSVLHDIGKVGIPDKILLKPGKLTPKEFEVMKMHCIYGSDVLAEAQRDAGNVSFLAMGRQITHFHHERWDGSGYPEGLNALDIPLAARIVALADVYDALTSKRCYKQALSHEQAREIIVRDRGSHFDPQVVDAFLAQEGDFQQIRMEILLQ
ncbi:MAG TPA: PAS domain S-box protein [Desulfobulbaceae bacterium]|nr:PAS domain S-box protein [Desulfobulbaceae bacterium]